MERHLIKGGWALESVDLPKCISFASFARPTIASEANTSCVPIFRATNQIYPRAVAFDHPAEGLWFP